jgi:hypothetical protein
MEIKLYGMFIRGEPGGQGLLLSLTSLKHLSNATLTIEDSAGDRTNYPVDTSLSWRIQVPDGSEIIPDPKFGHCLRWLDCNFHRHVSQPNEVNAMANLDLFGFRMLSQETT